MIPRTIFSAWIGSEPPEDIKALVKKAKRINEDAGWGYTFHGPEILAKYERDPYVRRLLAMGEKLAFVMDRIRLLMLKETGGFWVDSDCDFQRPMSLLNRMVDRPEVDYLTGARNPWRPGIALHRAVPIIDNTVMGSAPNGRMVNRLLNMFTADHPKQTGHDAGSEVFRTLDESVILLNYQYFYVRDEAQTPQTILLHDLGNKGSWCHVEYPPVQLK